MHRPIQCEIKKHGYIAIFVVTIFRNIYCHVKGNTFLYYREKMCRFEKQNFEINRETLTVTQNFRRVEGFMDVFRRNV